MADLRPPDIQSVYPKELDLFTKPKIINAIDEVTYTEIQAKGVLNEKNVIKFIIPKTGTEYIWLKRCLLSINCSIKKKDGTEIDPVVEKVAPVNLALHSFFDQIDVSFNGVTMNDPRPNHPY